MAKVESCVIKARKQQGVQVNNEGFFDNYPGRDSLQNGVISHGSDTTIYCTEWYDGQDSSGFFTDKATVDSCIENDGKLNSNRLGEALQTEPSNIGTDGGDYQHKPLCTAYDVDWDRLDSLKSDNPDLHRRLTNPDDKSPHSNDIKCAFGKAEANTHWGEGGGNQYYIDENTFNEAVDAGVFKKNPEKSFSEDKGNLKRSDISNTDEYNNKVTKEKDRIWRNDRSKNPSENELNSHKVKEDDYIAKGDPTYSHSNHSQEDRIGDTPPESEMSDSLPSGREDRTGETLSRPEMPNSSPSNIGDRSGDNLSESGMPNSLPSGRGERSGDRPSGVEMPNSLPSGRGERSEASPSRSDMPASSPSSRGEKNEASPSRPDMPASSPSSRGERNDASPSRLDMPASSPSSRGERSEASPSSSDMPASSPSSRGEKNEASPSRSEMPASSPSSRGERSEASPSRSEMPSSSASDNSQGRTSSGSNSSGRTPPTSQGGRESPSTSSSSTPSNQNSGRNM